ncbi:MAG TPA: nucleoside transporter C-terminal domain-containing protein [Candidatus Hydrogenedentes bacterium]|nr:nucleoside transporter C-terminal domain-containing protein [Candidatus Hydrogenedentota bacterium]
MAELLPRLVSLGGLAAMVGLAWLLSEHRSRVSWRIAAWGVGLQVLFALLILRTRFGLVFFAGVKRAFDVITEASDAGAQFVFGNLYRVFIIERVTVIGAEGPEAADNFPVAAVLAFHVLPVIIFVSALAAILQHFGIIQAVVRGMAWLMRRTLKTSGAETFGAALLVFLGIESVSALGGYLKTMTRSEIFTLMTAFLATIAASVMVAYAGFGASPGHLLAASIMSAPAALVMAKLLVPETGNPETAGRVRIRIPVESHSVFDAASRGGALGLNMALNVGAMLIVFVGMIYLLDYAVTGVTGRTTTQLLGWVFRPFALLMGVVPRDVPAVSELLAVKSVFNEFLAYQQLQPLIREEAISPRSITIATYALCGFANPGSLGIMIGALAALVPERHAEIAALSLRAFVAGTLACFATACVAGILA